MILSCYLKFKNKITSWAHFLNEIDQVASRAMIVGVMQELPLRFLLDLQFHTKMNPHYNERVRL
jgi:hypothetical protein